VRATGPEASDARRVTAYVPFGVLFSTTNGSVTASVFPAARLNVTGGRLTTNFVPKPKVPLTVTDCVVFDVFVSDAFTTTEFPACAVGGVMLRLSARSPTEYVRCRVVTFPLASVAVTTKVCWPGLVSIGDPLGTVPTQVTAPGHV